MAAARVPRPEAPTSHGANSIAWHCRILATCLIALWLAACGSDSDNAPETVELSPRVYVFKADLGGWAPNNGRWYSYQVSDQPCDLGVWFPTNRFSLASCFRWLTDTRGASGQWVSSTGPWWTDPNHMRLPGGDGFGFVNVVAFTILPAAFRTPANLDDAVVTFDARSLPAVSTVVADSREGNRQGHVYLWFQTAPRAISPCTPDASVGEDCTRQSDYILTGRWGDEFQLDRSNLVDGKTFRFALHAADAADWTCLGRGINVKYDCMGLASALTQVAVVGFLLAPVAPCPVVSAGEDLVCDTDLMASKPEDYLALGTFEFRNFEIARARERATLGRRLEFARAARPSAPLTWTSPRYAPPVEAAPGAGYVMKIGPILYPVRLGLGATRGVLDLAAAGYQIYLLPAGTDLSTKANTLLVVDRGTDGRFTKVVRVSPYAVGDTVGFHVDDQDLLVLRNDEVVYRLPRPCAENLRCPVYPFIAGYGDVPEQPLAYAY